MSPALFIYNLTNDTHVQLSQDAVTGSWSPDNTRIAFSHYRPEDHWTPGLEVVGVDGSGRVDLAAEIRASTGMDFEPKGTVTWSADGSEIAVQNSGDGQLYAIRLDTVSLRPVESHFAASSKPIPTAKRTTTWGQAKSATR